jgi:capsid protein
VYGTDRRVGDVRGQPLLSVVLQSLREIDRYRDSTQRKAFINSLLAMVVRKTENVMGSLPMTGGAVRRSQASVTDSTTGVTPRKLNVAQYDPGIIVDELGYGEEIEFKGGEGTDINFPLFEDCILSGIAWALEIPPEILKLSFSSNYSASQAAINEVKMTINLKWGDFGETFCSPVLQDFMLAETLYGGLPDLGILEAWRQPGRYELYAAWTNTEWYGALKPSTDVVKQAKGSQMLLSMGLTTRAREARVTTGQSYGKSIRRLKRENEQFAEAMAPLQALQPEPAAAQAAALDDRMDEIIDMLGDN